MRWICFAAQVFIAENISIASCIRFVLTQESLALFFCHFERLIYYCQLLVISNHPQTDMGHRSERYPVFS